MQELADRSALEDFADVVPGVPRNLGELIVASAEAGVHGSPGDSVTGRRSRSAMSTESPDVWQWR